MKQRITRSLLFLSFAAVLIIVTAFTHKKTVATDQDIIGRWDLTVNMGDRIAPSWLEVRLSGIQTLVGQFVADGGSARPIAQVKVKEGKIHFSIPAQWERTDKEMVFEATLENDQLKGTIYASNGRTYAVTGERAPLLKRDKPVVWGKPVHLLNKTNLDGWVAQGKNNQWQNMNGVLTSSKSGSNLMTTAKFTDFKLHVEFRYPAGSNSGVYLRGRYEVQVEDNAGKEPSSVYFGGVYGFLTPNEMAAKPAGEWQHFDITLIGRRVTVVANGKAIIVDQIIPGITGGAIDSKEGEPGPILLQGDHGPVEYRNIIITPAK
ncbi:MAG: 3-keto-disaccharide hydrolase [Bacteroidota bacterium]